MSEQFSKEELQRHQESVERPWVELPQVQEKARKFGLDVDKVTLGYAIDHMLGDDFNAFGFIVIAGKFDEESSFAARDFIVARLNWESGISQLPKEIRERAAAIKSVLEKSDWSTHEGFMNAYNIWKTDVKEYVLETAEKDPAIIKARKLFREMEERVMSKTLKRRIARP